MLYGTRRRINKGDELMRDKYVELMLYSSPFLLCIGAMFLYPERASVIFSGLTGIYLTAAIGLIILAILIKLYNSWPGTTICVFITVFVIGIVGTLIYSLFFAPAYPDRNDIQYDRRF